MPNTSFISYVDNPLFNQLVLLLKDLGYLSLETGNNIRLKKEQVEKIDEFGFFTFLILIYKSFDSGIKVLKNKDLFANECIVLFQSRDLYKPSLKSDKDSIIINLPTRQKSLTDLDKAIFKHNFKIVHPNSKLPNLRFWGDVFKIIKKNRRYLSLLGGNGLILKINNQIVDQLTDLPLNNNLISKLFDSYITIKMAAYYSDSDLYSANSDGFKKPFKSFEIDSFYLKINKDKLPEVTCCDDIKRLIVVETTTNGSMEDMLLCEKDFFSDNKNHNNGLSVKIENADYLPAQEANSTSFKNKIVTWNAFNNIGISKYCYILINFKTGITNPQWLDNQATGTTAFCLNNSNTLRLIESELSDPQFFKKEITSGKLVSSNKLRKPLKLLTNKFIKVLSQYR